MHDSDAILLSFLRATDEADRERQLGELITTYAAPLIRRTLWQHFGLAVDQAGANARDPDAEDLYQEAMAKLLHRLNGLRANPEKSGIKNFRQYVVRIALNAGHDYIRAKYPARSRLKNNLRDLLERHRDFKVWRSEADLLLCGFATWAGEGPAAAARADRLVENPEEFKATRLAGGEISEVPLSRLVAEIFNWVGGAVELDRLVGSSPPCWVSTTSPRRRSTRIIFWPSTSQTLPPLARPAWRATRCCAGSGTKRGGSPRNSATPSV